MHSPRPFSKFLLLLAILPLLPGCLVYDVLMMRKLHHDRLGDGGPYAQQIHSKMHRDREPGRVVFFTGMLPVTLASTDDKRARFNAWEEREPVSMLFWGVEDGKMCFRSIYKEDAFNDGISEQQRVDKLFRSYRLAAEFSGPENSPEVQKRNHVFPKTEFSALDEVELLEHRSIRRDGTTYLIHTYQVCGKALQPPKQAPAFLTVAIEHHNSAASQGDAYLLVWQLFAP